MWSLYSFSLANHWSGSGLFVCAPPARCSSSRDRERIARLEKHQMKESQDKDHVIWKDSQPLEKTASLEVILSQRPLGPISEDCVDKRIWTLPSPGIVIITIIIIITIITNLDTIFSGSSSQSSGSPTWSAAGLQSEYYQCDDDHFW